MKKQVVIVSTVASLVLWLAGSCWATAPGQEVNPNGFPSGEHFNLNIIGKKEGFVPPVQEYDEFGDPIYGNVVFVPQDGQGIELYMQSGKGRKIAGVTELQVIDNAAGFDGDGAVLQLPNNSAGYRVYARALATPTDNPWMTISPSLVAVEDDAGNDLLYLGLVTDNGFESADGVTLTRTKGKSTAVNITGLFEWTGDVCYFTQPDGTSTQTQKCCLDGDLDGIYDVCEEPVVVDGIVSCSSIEFDLLDLFCVSYADEWVFNIGDFVEYLWSMDNNGSKLIQIRFYPN